MPDDSWITAEYLGTLKQESESHISRGKYISTARRCQQWYKKPIGIVPIDDFDDMELPAQHATSRDNIIKEAVDEALSIFLKNDPVIRRYPHHPQDAGLVDDVDALYLSAWRNNGARGVVSSALREALITGMSTVKTFWDVKRKQIGFEKIDPGSIFYDPFASNDKRGLDCRYIIQLSRQRIDVVLQRYGTEAEIALGLREAQGRKSKKATFARTVRRMANLPQELLGRLIPPGGSGNSEEIADPFVDVYEYWIFPVVPNDASLVSGNANLDDAGYPYGVVVTMIEDYIVKIKKNPFAGTASRMKVNQDGIVSTESVKIGSMRSPYIPLYWDRLSDNDGNNRIYECGGMVEQMIPMQFNIDAMRRLIYINAKTTAMPGGVVIADHLVTPMGEITREPGDIIEVKDMAGPVSNSLQLFEGQNLPDYIFQMLGADEQKAKQRVGLKPGVTGQTPPQGTSHTPAMTLGLAQDAAFTPLWEHVKEVGFALEDMSVLMDGLMQQFYKPGNFMDVSEHGEMRFIEWTKRHITANFRREVVAAANTSFFDLDKMNRLAEITAISNEALMSQNPDLIQSTINLLVNTGYPDAYDWIQQLRQKLQQLQQQEQELQALGALGLSQQAGQPGIPGETPQGGAAPQQASPEAGEELTEEELAGLAELAAAEGMSEEEVMALIS